MRGVYALGTFILPLVSSLHASHPRDSWVNPVEQKDELKSIQSSDEVQKVAKTS